MERTGLPETVVEVWGSKAAQDFVNWLEERLRAVPLPPQIQISAFTARQQVNVFMLERVSNLLLADEPTLVQTESGWKWRVPVNLTFPAYGCVGCVGEVDVDARLGGVEYDDALLKRTASAAQGLAQRTLHPLP